MRNHQLNFNQRINYKPRYFHNTRIAIMSQIYLYLLFNQWRSRLKSTWKFSDTQTHKSLKRFFFSISKRNGRFRQENVRVGESALEATCFTHTKRHWHTQVGGVDSQSGRPKLSKWRRRFENRFERPIFFSSAFLSAKPPIQLNVRCDSNWLSTFVTQYNGRWRGHVETVGIKSVS